MKLSEAKRQKLLATGDALYHKGRIFVAIEALSDASGLAEDDEKPAVPEPKVKADGSK